MSNRAWMPLHIGDYLSDTGHLSAAEHGAYMLLIMHYWQKGELPADETLIRRIAKLSCDEWAESRSVLAALFLDGWRHKRIDEELAKADDIIAKRKAAGRQRGSKSLASAEQMLSEEPAKADTRAGTPVTNNLSDAHASDAGASDPRDALWAEGVASLKAMTGKSDGAARSLVGKWLKGTQDDCALVLSKIRAAKAVRAGEAVAWITAALQPQSRGPPKTQSDALRELGREAGIIDDTGSPIRRLEISDRDRDDPGVGYPLRVALPSH